LQNCGFEYESANISRIQFELMENKIFKVLHAYHPVKDATFHKVDVLVYRDALILCGYETLGKPMSSFLHLQFHDLQLSGIYSTQLQLAERYIPDGYKTAPIKNIYHCESHYVLVPQAELEGINSYTAFATLHSEPAEKLLIDDLDSILAREYYNYPFRVYNDLNFAFENANFYTCHRPIFQVLKQKSMGTSVYYASIKSKNIEIISFRDGQLLLSNIFEVAKPEDMEQFMRATLADLKMDLSSDKIYVSCVLKDEKDHIFSILRNSFPNMNHNVENVFGFPKEFWDSYGDLILCS
jgi:hypothetical protein